MIIKIIRNPDPNGARIHPFLLGTPEGEVIKGCTGFSIEFGVDFVPKLTAHFVEFDTSALDGRHEVFVGDMHSEPAPMVPPAPPAPALESCADFPGGIYPAVKESSAGKVELEQPKTEVAPIVASGPALDLFGKCNVCGFAAATSKAGQPCTRPGCTGMVSAIGLPPASKGDPDVEDMDPIR